MKNEISAEAENAQTAVTNAMGDISRATRKVLMDYVISLYLNSFGKVIAYLGPDSEEGKDLLNGMDEKTRSIVLRAAHDYQKSDDRVIAEVEHILDSCGMNLESDYQIIKENLLHTEKDFAKKALKDFREETPIFQKRLNSCLFNFDDLALLDDRAIQILLRDVDVMVLEKALKGAAPELQNKFFRNMPQRTTTMIKEDMEWMGPVRKTDVEEARTKILKILFALEAKGEIIISNITVGELIY